MIAFVGNFASDGITVASVDEQTLEMQVLGRSDPVRQPAFLALDRNGTTLFVALEVDDYEGGGALTSYHISEDGRVLERLATVPSGGIGPCHIAVSPDGRYLAAANYASGSISVTEIADNGVLGRTTARAQHSGTGPVAGRQDGPHAHSVNFFPGGRFLLVADLGSDTLVSYRFDSATGTVARAHQLPVRPGAGPRHVAFHPANDVCYVSDELTSTVSVFAYDRSTGKLSPLGSVNSRSSHDAAVENTAADIHVSSDGRHLYCSNRGDDTIGIFRVRDGGKSLSVVAHVPTEGRIPRNFAISPDGKILLVGNQESDQVNAFAVDPSSGELRSSRRTIKCASPTCLLLRYL